MSLSRKNLDRLKTYIKENKSVNHNSKNIPQDTNNSQKFDDPSEIFYSIIDNSENLNETLKENPFLKNSEHSFHNTNSRKPNYSNNLNMEDQLYDEFNYLLDE